MALNLTYGNGDFAEYLCDLLDRLVKVLYNEKEDGGRTLFLRCKRQSVKMKKAALGKKVNI